MKLSTCLGEYVNIQGVSIFEVKTISFGSSLPRERTAVASYVQLSYVSLITCQDFDPDGLKSNKMKQAMDKSSVSCLYLHILLE